MDYRLAIDLGTTSLGWAVYRLNNDHAPVALIRAGVRIFSDGREAAKNGGVGAPLAVQRRMARGLRRRRDRMLRRKARMMRQLVDFGFFPKDLKARKALEKQYPNPYELRAAGMERELKPEEFGRALFHLNQRRGFKSNRKLDKVELDENGNEVTKASDETSKMKGAISEMRKTLRDQGLTAGQWLYRRMLTGAAVRNREIPTQDKKGNDVIEKNYSLSIDRQIVTDEFDALWARQASFNPVLFNDATRDALRDTLLFQRPLKPVDPGRCTLLPDEQRAPLALPSSQRFRIYQEVNNLRIVDDRMQQTPLTKEQRDLIVNVLERGKPPAKATAKKTVDKAGKGGEGKTRTRRSSNNATFEYIRKLLEVSGTTRFNLEDDRREELKGNAASAALSRPECFGEAWFDFDDNLQDDIVCQLVNEDSEADLIEWLKQRTGVDDARAKVISNARLPEGYGNLSRKALNLIVPELRRDVITYDKAVEAAGLGSHSALGFSVEGEEQLPVIDPATGKPKVNEETGEIRMVLRHLPYYGKALQRHVSFGTNKREDPEEKRYGKIANPTVHIGLNQVRKVVNALIDRYGNPAEVVVELARDLKQSKKQREEIQREQTANEKRNKRIAEDIAGILGITPEGVRRDDIKRWILWEELSRDAADRRCPYSGEQISAEMLLSDQVEVEHILPFSRTLDDGMNNKTVCIRLANRVKGNRTPYEARADFERQGWKYEDILRRAASMPNKRKAARFAEDGYKRWLHEDKDFIARALNDTRYLSRLAKSYLGLVTKGHVRVITGSLTAMLRRHLGLNLLLGDTGEKNRNDHRHHAVDACVIGVTDQGLLQRFASANARADEAGTEQLVKNFQPPWPTFRDQVERAIGNIWVSHKPDHGFEGAMLEDTAHGIGKDGKTIIPSRTSSKANISSVNMISEPGQEARHGVDAEGHPLPYKGYVGGSNYCIEIFRNGQGKWEGEVISTFRAYQIVREAMRRGASREEAVRKLRDPKFAQNGASLVTRLMIDDAVRMSQSNGEGGGREVTMRIVKIASSSGQIFMAPINEANVDARNRDKDDPFKYTSKYASSFQKSHGRKVTVSTLGIVRDPGYSG